MISRTEAYVNSICGNIDDRFPVASTDVLGAFDVFNVENMPGDSTSNEFKVYGRSEIRLIGQHYFKGDRVKADKLFEEWEDFRYDLVQVKKKWHEFKDNIISNNMRLKVSPTEWTLKRLMRDRSSIEYPLVKDLIQIAMVTPVSNAWPEGGGQAQSNESKVGCAVS